jgi:hypothetical protein
LILLNDSDGAENVQTEQIVQKYLIEVLPALERLRFTQDGWQGVIQRQESLERTKSAARDLER